MSSVSIESIAYKPWPKAKSYSDIGWLPRLNVRREYGNEREMRETRDNLATPIGWDLTVSAVAEVAIDEEVKEILANRAKAYEDLKALLNEKELPSVQIPEDGKNVAIDGRDYLMAKIAVFEYFYLDKKSNWKSVSMVGTTGNRRGSCLLDAGTVQLILARRKSGDMKLQPSAETVTDHISICVPDTSNHRFPDVAVRKQAQIRENETKTSGFKRMTDAERLEAVLDLVENHGKNQADIRNSGYGSVLGLRLYFACVVDIFCRQMAGSTKGAERKLWEGINFLGRLMAPQFLSDEDRAAAKVNPMWLDFSKFQQKSFQGDNENLAMGLMCEVSSKFDKENKRRSSLKTPMSPLERPTAEVIQAWVQKNMFGGPPRQKPQLKRDAIVNLSERHPNPFIKDAMKAVDGADEAFLNVAKARAVVAQYAYQASDDLYSRLEMCVVGLRDLDEDTQLTLLQGFLEQVESAVELAEANKPAESEGEVGGETTEGAPEQSETSA